MSRFLSTYTRFSTRYNSAVCDQFLTVPSSHPSGSMVRRVGPVVLSMQAIRAVAKGLSSCK
ncbi:hypothetical protein QQ045_032177 [Rhodiola kirilowii]